MGYRRNCSEVANSPVCNALVDTARQQHVVLAELLFTKSIFFILVDSCYTLDSLLHAPIIDCTMI